MKECAQGLAAELQAWALCLGSLVLEPPFEPPHLSVGAGLGSRIPPALLMALQPQNLRPEGTPRAPRAEG